MVNADRFADQAAGGNYIGIPYSTLDCQAFVEKVLADCGIRRNWRGSNDMWRNAVHDRQVISGDTIQRGEWVFTIKHDGGEDKSRYHDGVNASHVGIYIGDGVVIHSTTGGVQLDNIMSARWTHHAQANDIAYSISESETLSDHAMLQALYDKFIGGSYK